MLSVRQFKKADIHAQSYYLNDHGVYLDVCIDKDGAKVALYALYDHYVEVYYEMNNFVVRKINCFKSLKRLEPFLPKINIDEINMLLKES